MSLPHQHSHSTVPSYWGNPPAPHPLLFDFCTSPGLFLFSPLLSSPFATLFLFPSIQPVAPWLCFQAIWEKERARGRGWSWGGSVCLCGGLGGRDKATSVSDTNMAQSQHQYYVYAPSFSASHRVTDPPHPPATRPAPIPSPIQVCPQPALSLSELLFWLKKAVVWPDGAVFSSSSTLSGSVGRGELFEWF